MGVFRITMPVLNEDRVLERNTERVVAFLKSPSFLHADKYTPQIVVADNGSTDRTREIGMRLEREYPDTVKYVRIDGRGIGRACKFVWGNFAADISGYMDVDLATDLTHLNDAISLIEAGADVVYGTRLNPKSVVRGRNWYREGTSRIFNFLLKRILKTNVSDGQCGFKFARRDAINRILATGDVGDGWFLGTEMLVIAQALSLNIAELPVRWTDSPQSKVNVPKLGIIFLLRMFRLRNIVKRIKK